MAKRRTNKSSGQKGKRAKTGEQTSPTLTCDGGDQLASEQKEGHEKPAGAAPAAAGDGDDQQASEQEEDHEKPAGAAPASAGDGGDQQASEQKEGHEKPAGAAPAAAGDGGDQQASEQEEGHEKPAGAAPASAGGTSAKTEPVNVWDTFTAHGQDDPMAKAVQAEYMGYKNGLHEFRVVVQMPFPENSSTSKFVMGFLQFSEGGKVQFKVDGQASAFVHPMWSTLRPLLGALFILLHFIQQGCAKAKLLAEDGAYTGPITLTMHGGGAEFTMDLLELQNQVHAHYKGNHRSTHSGTLLEAFFGGIGSFLVSSLQTAFTFEMPNEDVEFEDLLAAVKKGNFPKKLMEKLVKPIDLVIPDSEDERDQQQQQQQQQQQKTNKKHKQQQKSSKAAQNPGKFEPAQLAAGSSKTKK